MGIATDLIYIIIAALFGGILSHILKQPVVIGYILAGVIVGPYSGGLTVQYVHDVEKLAEIGVALLLFALGLEFSFKELRSVLKISLFGTPLQILLTIFVGYNLGKFIGLSHQESLWFGSLISLSSTMVVLKSLAMQDALNSLASRVMIGILIAQDLAIVPIILILPQATGDSIQYSLLAFAVVKSFLFLAAMFLLGTKLLPKFFSLIVTRGPRELFLLLTLAIALGIGYITYLLGLSFPFGAFIAGMVLSETDFNHRALGEIESLKDLFGLIFFVSVGMLLDPALLISEWQNISIAVITILFFKSLIISIITRSMGYAGATPFTVGLGLSQVGEFAFAIGTVGVTSGQLSARTYSFAIAITVITMVLTPVLIKCSGIIFKIYSKYFGQMPPPLENINLDHIKNHVIIAGASVIGQYVAKALKSLNIPFILVELDHRSVTELRKEYSMVLYGDVTHPLILKAAGIESAKLLVLALSDEAAAAKILKEAISLSPKLPISILLEDDKKADAMHKLGATVIVQPKYEAALELLRESLVIWGKSESSILGILGTLRSTDYVLDKIETGKLSDIALNAARHFDFDWVEIPGDSPVMGKTLESLKVRAEFGVSIVAIVRKDTLINNPGSTDQILENDLIGYLGAKSQVSAFRGFLLGK